MNAPFARLALLTTACALVPPASAQQFQEALALQCFPPTDPGTSFGLVGDLDGDGDLDMTVSSIQATTSNLLRNRGGGSFEAIASPAWSQPNGVPLLARCLLDIDADGDLDAIADTNLLVFGYLRVLRNDGAWQWTDATAAVLGNFGVLGSGPGVTGDFDGDGRIDFVVGNLLFRRQANGTFGAPTSLPINTTNAVQAADFDRDGDLDLLFGLLGIGGTSLALFRNDGPGTFTDVTSTSLPQLTSTTGLTVLDADGDGDLDVHAVAPLSPLRQALLVNAGNGTFTIASGALPVVAGLSARSVALDFDDDGDLDLAIAKSPCTLYRNDGTGRFVDDPSSLPPTMASLPATGVLAADLDGNGRQDLIFSGFSSSSSPRLLLATAPNTFVDATAPRLSGAIDARVIAVDLDQDGWLDLVSPNGGVLRNDGTGGLVPGSNLNASGTTVLARDFTGDGLVDLLFDTARYFAGNGVGFTEVTSTHLQVGPAAGQPTAADFDGDGDLDVFTSGPAVWANNGVGVFQLAVNALPRPSNEVPTRTPLAFVLAVDLDLDHDADVIAWEWATSTTVAFVNDGSGRFSRQSPLAPNVPQGNVSAQSTADFDRDGDPDLLQNGTFPGTGDTFRLLDNQAGILVDITTSRFVGATTTTGLPIVVDIDADGDEDLLFATARVLWRNDGQGHFTNASARLPARLDAGIHVAADFDRDGDQDLIGALYWTDLARDLTPRNLPHIGGPATWTVHAAPGELAAPGLATVSLALARAPHPVSLGALGEWHLDSTAVSLGLQVLGSPIGTADFATTLPANATLIGQSLFAQGGMALGSGVHLTNLTVGTIF